VIGLLTEVCTLRCDGEPDQPEVAARQAGIGAGGGAARRRARGMNSGAPSAIFAARRRARWAIRPGRDHSSNCSGTVSSAPWTATALHSKSYAFSVGGGRRRGWSGMSRSGGRK